jgi:chromosomal replication initiator protein
VKKGILLASFEGRSETLRPALAIPWTDPALVQSVISIPLGNGSAAASAAAKRERPSLAVFDEFIVGPENRLASIAVKAIFEERTHGVTPLVLYGPTGTGKTHLALGLAEWWERHHPNSKVIVVTGREFAQQYADAVETDRITAWRARLRAADLLVLDDPSDLVSKRGAQQELRHLLDDFHDRDAPVIVATPVLPALLAGLSESLQSRLSNGLCVPVNIPASATRKIIIDRFAQARGMNLPKLASQLLADALNVPVPQLLGALMELDRAAGSDGLPIDADRIRRYLHEHHHDRAIAIRDIAAASAKYFSLKLADLKSPSRKKAVVTARNTAICLARELTDKSLEQIGAYFGGRDHTTILHGFRKTEALAKSDPVTRQAFAEIKRLIGIQ